MQFRSRSGGLALLLFVLLLVAVPGAEAASRPAKSKTSTTQPKAKSKPKPGWLVDRVRLEPLDPAGTVAVSDVGEYRGRLDLVPTAGQQSASNPAAGIAVVNEVGLEDYVRGLAEVPSTWPLEAQKAQAIAARTYALHELALDPTVATAARAVGAQICATDACQVYTGVAKERDPDTATAFGAWATAVEQTRGEVVLFQNSPINAKYSSSNGGRSIGGGQPYLRPIDDPDDRYSPLFRWRSQILGTDVANALGLTGGVVEGLRRSGDQLVVDWRGPDGGVGQLAIHVNDFRSLVNAAVPAPPGLPKPVPFPRFSPMADPSTNTVILDGGGWGHGIGMSQWGAYGKALRGMKAADILAAYYGGLRPTRLDGARLPKTIRVAVELGRAEVDAAGTGGWFRVLDQHGAPIAVAANGGWRFVPEGKGIRVLPPPGQEQAPAVEPLAVDPVTPKPGIPLTIRFRLAAPALVGVAVVDQAGRSLASVPAQLRDSGELAQSIPALDRPGRYTVSITADAGGGRTAAVPVPIDVRPVGMAVISPLNELGKLNERAEPAVAAGLSKRADPGDRNAAAALALTLLLIVASTAVRAEARAQTRARARA